MVSRIGPEELRELTPWCSLIEALEHAFRSPLQVPERVHLDISGAGSLLVMPAWEERGLLGVKIVQVFPGNSAIGKPAVDGIYMLASATSGEVHSLVDAQELTARRSAGASALASKFLSREGSQCLLVMGTGRLAFEVICAHASIRPITRVLIWGRRPEKALCLASSVRTRLEIEAEVVESVPEAVARADIISTVTAASEPILPGRYIRPGTHIDLIGGFTPRMREADDEAVRGASIYVDAAGSAVREAGDIASPLERGIIQASDIRGDLFDLCGGRIAGRISDNEITLFKSVGIALEDLATASLAWNSLRMRKSSPPLPMAASTQ